MDDMACIDLSDQEGDGGGGFFGPKLPIQICLILCLLQSTYFILLLVRWYLCVHAQCIILLASMICNHVPL
jgi:hypothetical protein